MAHDVLLVGSGAIAALRHLPAVMRVRGARVLGVIGTDAAQVEALAGRARGARRAVVAVGEEGATLPDWALGADLAVVGTPPRTHTRVARQLAAAGVPMLVEKPLLVDVADRAEWERLALGATPIGVMHNFRFSRGFLQVERWIAEGRIGDIVSVQCLQWSSDTRRLPRWYRDLPLGLFWDESAHFLYLSRLLAGQLQLRAAHAVAGTDPAETTPRSLDVQLVGAAGVPVSIAMRFGTAISEWGLVIAGTRGTIVHDMYRDVPVLLPDDGPHRARQIVRTSIAATVQHWRGTVGNGVRILRGTQLYGVDTVVASMLAVERSAGASGVPDDLHVRGGIAATDLMRTIVERIQADG